jgi:cyanophycinase
MESDKNNKSIGPRCGTLVIVGGDIDGVIVDEFVAAAGGSKAHIVCIPTAGGPDTTMSGFANVLGSFGITNVTVLHTLDKIEADSEEFAAPLREADGVWFDGGRQWYLVDAYKDTLTERLIHGVLERGGVIGGTSAGATIQGSYLARGDSGGNQKMMGDHEEGFSFLKNVAIDQHVLARNRHFDMFVILMNRPELLGIGIDEKTAIVVRGDEFKVLGTSYVLVYDGSFWSREGSKEKILPKNDNLFYFLRKGDRYDLRNRKVINAADTQDAQI